MIRSFIPDLASPESVAVDATYIYWTSGVGGVIGRAKLNGTGVDQSFINADVLGDVAVDAGHIYWTDRDTQTIGRAKLDGTGVDQSFIETAGFPHKLAVDADHLYWADFSFN